MVCLCHIAAHPGFAVCRLDDACLLRRCVCSGQNKSGIKPPQSEERDYGLRWLDGALASVDSMTGVRAVRAELTK